MALPRLRADLGDDRAVARVLRAALRHEVAVVRLHAPPTSSGQHLLEVDVPGEGPITLLADPAGLETSDGQPLHMRPVTRPQMAALLSLVERLDEPSKTIPPAAAADAPFFTEPLDDRTIVDRVGPVTELPPFSTAFGVINSSVPGPPSSGAARPPSSVPRRPPSSSNLQRVPRPPTVAPPANPSLAPVAPNLLIGRVLARKYELEAVIGSGSTADVFRAKHLDLKRSVAVKILHQSMLDEKQFVRRFKGEALSASKLEHPNVARVMDFGQETDGLLYLVMELLIGKSLEAIIAAEVKIPVRTAVTIAMQACSALAFAHDEGIIHRDVKPENIMIVASRDDDGNPCDLAKVCDFGLAKLRDREPGEDSDLTTTGMLCGSPAYMSPEQTRGETIDQRSDIYSLGVTLFESLTGAFPHEATSLTQLFLKKLTEPAKQLSSVADGIDPLLEDIVMRALSTDPRGRHANARVLREELREVLMHLDDDDDDDRFGTIVAE